MFERRKPLPPLLSALCLGGIFLLCAVASIAATRSNGGIALIWTGNAIVAALLIRMRSVPWTATAAAVLVSGVAANLIAGQDTWQIAVALTLVNMGEIAVAVLIFRVLTPLPYPRISIYQAAYMTLIMGGLITGLAAVAGGMALHLLAEAPLWPTVRQWWSSDALGACLLAPPLILYSRENLLRLLQPGFLWRNLIMLPVCVAATWAAIRYVQFPFVLIALVPMIAAYQMGAFGTSVLSLCNATAIIILWVAGVKPVGLGSEPMAQPLMSLPVLALIVTAMPPIAIGIGNDARRMVVRALRASEQRFRESMEGSPLGMIMLDRNGQWSFTNTALQAMLGYSKQELSQMTIESLAHPDDLHDIWERWGKLMSQQIDSYKISRRFLHKDGHYIWVDCAVSLARDEEGLPMHFVAQIESLEERRRAEAALAAERELLRATLASIGDAVITTDADERITYMNDAAASMLGRPYAAVSGRILKEVIDLTDPATGTRSASLVDRCRAEVDVVHRPEPCQLKRPDGSVRYIADAVTPVMDGGGQLTGFVKVMHDVTDSLQRTRDLKHRAEHDPLTNLLNRLAFERELHKAFSEARSTGTPATLIALDLDRFKAVNDSAGHAAGDAVLRHVAAVLRRSVRPSDSVARLGGDEFIVLLHDCDLARSHEVSERLLEALNPLRTAWEDAFYSTGASLGLAQCNRVFEDPGEWLRAADAACYESKRSGRGILRRWQNLAESEG